MFPRFNQPKTLSGIETEYYSWMCHYLLVLQPTQNPFRDWNQSSTLLNLQSLKASTNPKPFQGLKQRLSAWLSQWVPASTNPKPFQGLKQGIYCASAHLQSLQPTQNPFRDWNTLNTWIDKMQFLLQPTQNPFRDWNVYESFMADLSSGFNQPKTLSGIETTHSNVVLLGIFASTNPKPFQGLKQICFRRSQRMPSASTNPKPFQGLKHQDIGIRSSSDRLQPTQNPFRDWNTIEYSRAQ